MKKKAQRAADMVSCAPKTCLYFSIGINIFLAIFVSVLAIYFNTLDKETVENKDVPKPSTNIAQKLLQANVSLVGDLQSSVCFNCDYLGEDVNTNETLYDDIYTTDRQNKLCCLKDTAIQEFIRAIQNEDNHIGNANSVSDSFHWWRERPCAAHLYLDRKKSISKENKLRWVASDSLGTAFTKDIDLQNATHLQIMESGNYFIYSSTTFDHSKDIYVETFYQSLTKFHPLLPRTGDVDLVFSKFGGSKTSDKHHTNFLAGVFELQRGYLISSSLSQSAHNFLDQSNQVNNYIGLFKL